MSYVWLDITTIYGWNRPAVGIIRVESEFAAFALGGKSENTRFCRFDIANKAYVEVPAEQVCDVLARIRMKYTGKKIAKSADAIFAVPSAMSAMSAESRVVAFVKRLISLVPQRWRASFVNFAARRKSVFQAGVRSYREARLAFRELVRPSGSSQFVVTRSPSLPTNAFSNDILFASDDVYVSLGLDWDQKDLVYLFGQKRRVGFKVLLFCYDVIPVKLPHLCVGDVAAKFGMYFSNLAWCADKVLCISEYSRKDLTQLLTSLGTPIPPMEVIKLGCDIRSPIEADSAADVAALLRRKYILFVSTIERRKNHETLYRAYTRLIDRGMIDLPFLVFVGMPGWGVNDFLADLRLDPRIQPYIRILNNVTDNDLACLYQNAYFTIFPSLYEGWGLPVAESLALGKFCLASNAASIPEVGGALLEYIDPWDVPKWAERIKWFIDHEADLILREHQIKNEYKRVTWKSSASAIFEAAIRLCKN